MSPVTFRCLRVCEGDSENVEGAISEQGTTLLWLGEVRTHSVICCESSHACSDFKVLAPHCHRPTGASDAGAAFARRTQSLPSYHPPAQAFAVDVELTNIGSVPVALSLLKVELVLDQGATQLLGEWVAAAAAPAAADSVLQPGEHKVLPVRFDVRDLGVCSLSCSAVFRGE